MRLDFPPEISTPKAKSKKSSGKKTRSVKKDLSASDIRAKLQARKMAQSEPASKVKLSDAVKQKVEIKDEMGDLQKNDPTNPHTLGKVKEALSLNMVNFSDKERAVLDEILGQ